MPYALNQEAIDSPTLQVMDISKPPLKQIAHQEYPKMVYLHPIDKTKEHKTKIVNGKDELDAAIRQGWKTNPHIPIEPEAELDPEEYEMTESEVKRGPGRPRKEIEN